MVILITAGAICFTVAFGTSKPVSSVQRVLPGYGGLAGQVFGPDGKPVAGAEVYVEALDEAPFVGQRPWSRTDEDGRFFINNAKPGLNRVCASKEEDGYPDPSFLIYRDANAPPPEVVVQDGQINRGIIISFRQKSERLLISVADADTSSTVKHATITIYSANNPDLWTSFGTNEKGKLEILMPLVPANIRVSAVGYLEARDLNVQALSDSARLQALPEKVNEITICLRRAK